MSMFYIPANRYIFKSRLNCSESTVGSLRQSGNEFQTVGPAREKARVPKVPHRIILFSKFGQWARHKWSSASLADNLSVCPMMQFTSCVNCQSTDLWSKQRWIYIALYYKLFISKALRYGPFVKNGIARFYLLPTHEPYLPLLASHRALSKGKQCFSHHCCAAWNQFGTDHTWHRRLLKSTNNLPVDVLVCLTNLCRLQRGDRRV